MLANRPVTFGGIGSSSKVAVSRNAGHINVLDAVLIRRVLVRFGYLRRLAGHVFRSDVLTLRAFCAD